MAKVIPDRFTAQTDEAFVVFIIGMCVNKFLAFCRWIPTALSMGPMLRTLFQHPEKGMLGGQVFFYWRGIALVQSRIPTLLRSIVEVFSFIKRKKS